MQNKKPNGYWTEERCLEDALKYKSKVEWNKNSPAGYSSAYKKGWMTKCTQHMQETNKPHGYWTKERCIEDALKYNTRMEWNKNSKSAYTISNSNKWDDECCKHMTQSQHPAGYWTKERCVENASKYNSKKEWGKNSRGAYKSALRNKWLEECTNHMKEIKKPKGYWNLDKCKEDALKYKTRKEWSENSYKAYCAARWNKWMDECCGHMEHIGHKYKRMIYVYEFPDNHVYIGLTYHLQQRNDNHFRDINSAVYKHLQETNLQPILKEISNYIPVREAQELEEETKNKYQENGWVILNRAKTGGIGGIKHSSL